MSQFIEMFGDAKKVKLGELATFVNGSAFKPEEWSETGLPIVRIQNLTGSGDVYNRYNGDTTKKVIIEPGDILISWSATLGVYIWTGEKALLNQHIFRADIDKEKVDKDFFIYTVQAELNIMGENAHGSTMKHIVKKDFDNTLVAYPSLAEQRRFSVIYKQADKSEFVGFKSQFIEMFKGDDQVPLGDICNIEKGATITRNDVLPGDVPVVAGGQEPSCYHNVANREAGAITVSASGAYAGYINFWSSPIFASDCNTVISKDNEKTDQTFVYFGLKAMQKQIYGLQKGGAQPHVYGKDLQKIMFPHPSYAKQIEFSKMAKQADKSGSELRKSIESIDKVIKSLINEKL